MTLSTLSVPALVSLLSLTALGCSETGDADFSDLNDDQRSMLAAMPHIGPIYGAFSVWIAEADSAGGCPEKSTDGPTVTYRGGCTTAAGDRYEGVLIGTNVSLDLFEPLPDPAAASSFEFRDFELIQVSSGNDPDQSNIFNGLISFSIGTPEAGVRYTTVYDYSVDGRGSLFDDRFAISATLDCVDSSCEFEPGSTASLDSLGAFTIDGGFAFVETEESTQATGRVTLRGLQELVIDYGAQAPDCVVFELEGAPAGTVCSEEQ